MSLNLRDLEDAEQFQKHFVTPLVDAVKQQVQPIVDQAKGHEDRLNKIEGNQRRALAGLAVYATALSVAVGLALDWVRKKIGL